jgi:5'-nucleotidase (lipoprotein e(P4) family)
MKHIMKAAVILMFVGLYGGCAQVADETASSPSDNNFNSTLWMQSSAEFGANSLQTYQVASRQLGIVAKTTIGTAALEQTGDYTSLPPAVIMDIDETVLDNSGYDAKLILEGDEYSSNTWDEWLSLKQAVAVPGAVRFVNYAKSTGVEVIFITNRKCMEREAISDKCPQKTETIENLQKVGIKGVKPSHLLLRNEQPDWSAEKESRRKFVAENYRIIMLLGDDLGDFLPNVKKNITSEQRANLVSEHGEKWGSVWYILPNPKYGSWLHILEKPKSQYLEGY